MNIREQGWTNRETRVREDRAAARHKKLEDNEVHGRGCVQGQWITQ